jgi:hypothetical protein
MRILIGSLKFRMPSREKAQSNAGFLLSAGLGGNQND